MNNGSDITPYGLMAEFKTPNLLRQGARQAREEGYQEIEAYTPFPVEGLEKILNRSRKRARIPLFTLIGGCIVGAGIYLTEYYAAVIDFPINIGGRPHHSWPAFIPVVVEVAILGAALGAVITMFLLSGLPRLYHPVFNVPQFDRATQDRFFLCIGANDARFDKDKTRHFLESLEATDVYGVEE